MTGTSGVAVPSDGFLLGSATRPVVVVRREILSQRKSASHRAASSPSGDASAVTPSSPTPTA